MRSDAPGRTVYFAGLCCTIVRVIFTEGSCHNFTHFSGIRRWQWDTGAIHWLSWKWSWSIWTNRLLEKMQQIRIVYVGPAMYCMWRPAVEIFPRCQSFVRGIHWLRKWRTKCLPVKLVDRMDICVNSSPPSATYLRRDIGLALVSIMTFHLLSPKPLSKQMLCYCLLDLKEQTSVKLYS